MNTYLRYTAAFVLAFAMSLTSARATPDASPNELTIRPVGNTMTFEQTSFTVQAGEKVTIIFENTATNVAMVHNVVVLTDAGAINRVGTGAIQVGAEAEYIPDDDAILAYTPLAKPGETVEVTFTAPSTPGDYPYICTYPGHYAMMQGTMTVVAP